MKVKSVKTVGHYILVEHIDAQTALNTKIIVNKDSKSPPQAYIRGVGPNVELDKWGFAIGDRVLLQGNYVPVPDSLEFKDKNMGIVEAHNIKCVITVDDE